MDVTRVSIVIATCDRPQLLERALASVAAQQELGSIELEVLVIDDAGTERVDDVIERTRALPASAITSLQLLRNDENLGRSASRNRAIAAATGDVLGFLDDDDLLHPVHVRLLADVLSEAQETVIAVAASEVVVETPEGFELSRRRHHHDGEVSPDLLLLDNVYPIQAALTPTSLLRAIGGFDETLEVLEDWDLWLRLAALAPSVYIDRVTSEYRHRTGRGNSLTREGAQYLLNLERIYERYPLQGHPDAAVLEQQREAIRTRARTRLPEAWLYDRSVLASIAPDAGPADLGALLDRVVGQQETLGGTWQLVLALPRTDELLATMEAVSGDLIAHWYPADAAEPVDVGALRRRAVGRDVVLDSSLDASRPADVT